MKGLGCRILSVASGKGGVGKTSFSLNLAYALARQNKRVCIIDADLGLANIDVVLGINPEYTLEDVIFNGKSLEDIIYKIDEYLYLLPGSSGIPALADLSKEQRKTLITGFSSLRGYDFIIIDNSPGIVPSVLSFCLATKELIVVFTPEPTSITDGYGLIKSLKESGLYYPPLVVLNKAKGKRQIKSVIMRVQEACKKFLGLSILFLGAIFEDTLFEEELRRNSPISRLYPDSLPAKCYRLISKRLITRPKRDLFYTDPKEVIKQSVIQFINRAYDSHSGREDIDPVNLLHSIRIKLENGVYEKRDKIFFKKIKQEVIKLEQEINSYLMAKERDFKIGVLSLDATMRGLISDILRDRGYKVIDVSSENMENEEVDLIVYHHLPNKQLSSPLKDILNIHIPVLVISSFNSYPHLKNIKGFLRAPFNIDDFYMEVQNILSQDK